MEHIRQIDWYYSEVEHYFVKEEDLDACATERILRNQFRDPMISSESEDENPNFNWDEIFAKQYGENNFRVFVPGYRGIPPYPKQSTLTNQQHYQCLKVLCAQNPKILETEFIARPTKQDYKVFEEVQAAYIKEQLEYTEWAKNLWTTSHCIRALRPKPPIETTYEAEYEMKAKELESFPKSYAMAAQIPLESRNEKFEMVFEKELISVDFDRLPQIDDPNPIKKKISIMVPQSVPEPCTKHPCRFVLPNESFTTMLPLTEVHRELADFAKENGAQVIASEKALKCLIELDRNWTMCLSMCQVATLNGETHNVLVLGGEFSTQRECSQMRTYRAFRHMLEYALIPDGEKSKLLYKSKKKMDSQDDSSNLMHETQDSCDSSDEDNLFIVTDETQEGGDLEKEKINTETDDVGGRSSKQTRKKTPVSSNSKKENSRTDEKEKKNNDYYKCNCQDLFEHPPPRSYRSWLVREVGGRDSCRVVVHCSHRLKYNTGEVILEPIPEYQLDLGASALSPEKVRSQALSLHLRRNATLLNVRIDGNTGEVVRCDEVDLEGLCAERAEPPGSEELLQVVSDAVGTALNQLQGLLPGHYLLRHEPGHGANALLYRPRASPGDDCLLLDFSSEQRAELDEAAAVKTPPALVPILLPLHKYRKILPCAFTPYESQVAKESKKPSARQRAPPQAITVGNTRRMGHHWQCVRLLKALKGCEEQKLRERPMLIFKALIIFFCIYHTLPSDHFCSNLSMNRGIFNEMKLFRCVN